MVFLFWSATFRWMTVCVFTWSHDQHADHMPFRIARFEPFRSAATAEAVTFPIDFGKTRMQLHAGRLWFDGSSGFLFLVAEIMTFRKGLVWCWIWWKATWGFCKQKDEEERQRAHTDSGRQSFMGALVVLTRLVWWPMRDLWTNGTLGWYEACLIDRHPPRENEQMSPEIQWLEDVFPTELSPFLLVSFRGWNWKDFQLNTTRVATGTKSNIETGFTWNLKPDFCH